MNHLDEGRDSKTGLANVNTAQLPDLRIQKKEETFT